MSEETAGDAVVETADVTAAAVSVESVLMVSLILQLIGAIGNQRHPQKKHGHRGGTH
jgi:hypothetical protein